jgi:hypothetical protein
MVNSFVRFAQGFESGSNGYIDETNGWSGATTEVPSGTGGIAAASGASYSIFSQTDAAAGLTGPFTRFDGYRNFGAGEAKGVTTQIKIYLDPDALAAGEGFDYSVAANGTNGAHLRDFIFHVTMDTSTGDLLIGASNNTNFDPREDLETITHADINTAGWYTLEHVFGEAIDASLAVTMNVYDSVGTLVFTQVLNTPADDYDLLYGGNRYGWFTNIDVAGGIAVDDAKLLTEDANPVQVYDGNTIIGSYASIADAKLAADNGEIAAATLRIQTTGLDDSFFYVADGMSIQAAIDAASAGDTVEVADGVYNESLTITKGIVLIGEDVGGDGVPDVTLNPVGANGVSISGDIDNGGAASVTINGFAISGATTSGINISSSTNLSSLVITNSDFSNNGVHGVGSGSGAPDLDSISITNSTFTDNGQGGANGSGDIILFGFNGDAVIQDVTITSTATEATAVGSRGDNAIQISGFNPATYDVYEPIGAITLDNVTVDGWYHKPQLLIQGYTDFNGLTLTDVDLSGGTSWGDLLFVDPIATSGADAPGNPGAPGNFLLTGGTSTLDLSGVTINSGSTGVLGVDSRVRGTDADDNITGTDAADLLNDVAETGIDYGGNDTVSAGGGDDIVIGGLGDDSLDGGDGHDTALFFGNGADFSYTVAKDANGFVTSFTSVTDNNAGDGDEGADALVSIEKIVALGDGEFLDAAQPVQLFDASDNLIGTFDTIQSAVDAAGDGDTILVSAGTYREQVVVNNIDSLTIRGIGDVTIEAPDALVQTTTSTSGRDTFSVVTVIDSANAVFENIDVDGRGITAGLGGVNPNNAGVYYRNASGGLDDVNVTGVRDPYPGGVTIGGEDLVSGAQRGVAVIADNDAAGARLGFFMHGGSISDFQKNGTAFVHADIDISGVTITGGGAQTIIAQNGIQAVDSTGSVTGNTIVEIGYAGLSFVYSGLFLGFDNVDLDIKNNTLVGTNDDTLDAKVIGVFIFDASAPNSGGEISGNTIAHVDTGIGVYGDIQPDPIVILNNTISDIDVTDPFAAGVDHEPNAGLATAFNVEGSAVADILLGSDAADFLSGLTGGDLIDGGLGNDTLQGGGDEDTIGGGDGDDRIFGGGGDDLLDGGAGDDVLNGGSGSDTADYSAFADGVTVDLMSNPFNFLVSGAGHASGSSSGIDGLTSIEIVVGTQGVDSFSGSNSADSLFGEDGDDVIAGKGGDDSLRGDGGNDHIFGGVGDDSIAGGDGDDTIDGEVGDDFIAGGAGSDKLAGLTGNDTIAGNTGNDTIQGGGGNDNLHGNGGFDRVSAGSGNDKVTGGGDADTLIGANGDDTVIGNGGDDKLIGNQGADKLVGLDGADLLFGGAGEDTLKGGAGNDTMSGGVDSDRFEFESGDGADVITDFSSNSGDVLVFTGFGAAFDDISDVAANSSQVGADVVIDLGGGNSLTLLGVNLIDLEANDFIFG